MSLSIGVDFHPHQQTVCWCDTATGDTDSQTLPHNLEQVREFYQKLPPAIIGIEATGKSKNKGISRAGSPLARFLLGQSANIAARYDPKFKAFYKRLAGKKPKPVAKTATARKVLVKLVIMMRDAHHRLRV